MRLTPQRAVIVLALGAAAGFGIFGVLVYRAVDIEHLDREEVTRRFAAVRGALPPGRPLLAVDEKGNVVRQDTPQSPTPAPIRRLSVLVYHADARRLVSADVPFWFFQIKGPAAQYALRDTGFDLDRLGITPAELRRYGPAVVLDQAKLNGDLLLVWTE